jgi:hypothetical protein
MVPLDPSLARCSRGQVKEPEEGVDEGKKFRRGGEDPGEWVGARGELEIYKSRSGKKQKAAVAWGSTTGSS